MSFRNCILSISCAIIFLHPVVNAQKLSKDERRIISIIEKFNRDPTLFLEKTVNINSGTMNPSGVREVGAIYKTELDALGFQTKWIDMPKEMNRAGHLFAERQGKKGKRLLLIGHLDTVFEPDSPFQMFMPQDSIAYGPGTNDMKGGNMILLYALKALYQANVLNDTQIIVALHGDEENAGDPKSISRKDIVDAAKRSDVALAFETSTGFNDATIARRGSSKWQLKVTGKQAHSSGIFSDEVGAGAIYEASRILHQFYTDLQEELLTYSPGLIVGGTTAEMDADNSLGKAFGKSNVVPQEVLVDSDLRFISEEQKEKVRNKMREIVKSNLPHTDAEIVFEDSYPAMSPTAGNMRILEMLSQVSLDLRQGSVKPFDPGKRGAGDISFVAQYLDCLDGLGAMGGGAHSPNEYVDLRTINDLIKRTAILIYRLTR
ncbi:MAG TPA: M20/M25/M40 family metallo-hydrolase [Cyclobacteriaceae bacterium]|nr:M20/M25/M40 family metallo-hydrolase [Cyclobacteriaceae bacterium]